MKGPNDDVDEKNQCWLGGKLNTDIIQITKKDQVEAIKNSNYALLQTPVETKENGYLKMKFYFQNAGTDRYGKYFKPLESYFRLEVYKHGKSQNHDNEKPYVINQDHLKSIKREYSKASIKEGLPHAQISK